MERLANWKNRERQHRSPNPTLNVYGRSRWDRKAGMVERIEDAISQENSERIAQPKFAVLGNSMKSSGSLVAAKGFEPPTLRI